MKKFIMALLAALALTAEAASVLTWQPPTEYSVTNEPIQAGDLTEYVVYRSGIEFARVPATTTTYEVSSSCTQHQWAVSAVAALESATSNVVTSSGISCRPKPPAGLTVTKN